MIWDRWEDAMDDLDDEASALRREIADLEQRLRELGKSVPSETPRPPSTHYPSDSTGDQMHREAWDDVARLRARRDLLIKLMVTARDGGGS